MSTNQEMPGDHRKMVKALRRLDAVPSADRCWRRPPAVRAIDCVLSLGHNYYRQVVPRLNRFEHSHPGVATVSQLRGLMQSSPTRHGFVLATLCWNSEHFAQKLYGVIDWLATVSGDGSPKRQVKRLVTWARDAQPEGHKQLSIPYFGLAGFQYMRMLFDADTVKPDLHIIRWVSGVIGREAGGLLSLRLLEAGAREVGSSLRDLDTTIWESSARSNATSSGNKRSGGKDCRRMP